MHWLRFWILPYVDALVAILNFVINSDAQSNIILFKAVRTGAKYWLFMQYGITHSQCNRHIAAYSYCKIYGITHSRFQAVMYNTFTFHRVWLNICTFQTVLHNIFTFQTVWHNTTIFQSVASRPRIWRQWPGDTGLEHSCHLGWAICYTSGTGRTTCARSTSCTSLEWWYMAGTTRNHLTPTDPFTKHTH